MNLGRESPEIRKLIFLYNIMGALPWSKKDLDYLNKNYGKIKTTKLCLKLNRKLNAVQNKAIRLGLRFKKPKIKNCTSCKKPYPRTNEYFFDKVIKQKNIKGDIVIYNTYRSSCKICHGKDGCKRTIKKKCIKLNCTISEYDKAWRLKYSFDRLKYKELKGLTKSKRASILKKMNKGYKFINMEDYKKDCSVNVSLARRKHDYGVGSYDRKLTQKEINRKQLDSLSNAIVCNKMGLKLSDVNKDEIELKRLIIQLKRELKSNNVKIK